MGFREVPFKALLHNPVLTWSYSQGCVSLLTSITFSYPEPKPALKMGLEMFQYTSMGLRLETAVTRERRGSQAC